LRRASRHTLVCFFLFLPLLASCSWNFSSKPVEPPDGQDDEDVPPGDADAPDAADDSGDDGAGEEPPADAEGVEDEGEAESEDTPVEDAACLDCVPDAPNAPPTVSVTAPADGEMILASASTDVRAEAADADGTVEDIRIYLDGDLVAEDAADSLVWTWSSPAIGRHVLSAQAEDDRGASGTSGDVGAVVYGVARFQDGVGPDADYAGTADTAIGFTYPDTNRGASSDLEADGLDGAVQVNVSALIRWDLGLIPPDAEVLDAELTLFPVSWANGSDPFAVYEVLVPWGEMTATWNLADTGRPWEVAGCQGAADRGATILGTVQEDLLNPILMAATPAFLDLIQRWVTFPSQNMGVVIQDFSLGLGLHFYSSEHSVPAVRPLLEITYTR
jgi:hypothetical protein